MNKRSKQVYELAFGYERDFGNCSQATLKALMDVYGEENDLLYRGVWGASPEAGLPRVTARTAHI
jgi:hypothetical protein